MKLKKTSKKTTHHLWLVLIVCLLLAGCVMPPTLAPQELIAPEAAQWGTWVLESSSELRPAAPPDAEATATELAALQAMVATVDDQALSAVRYWNAGAPNYRWIELTLEQYDRPGPAGRTLALVNVAMYDAIVATWDAKYTYNRPRPSGVPTLIDMPASPSYPSEYAAAASAAATVLAHLFPDNADFFMEQAEAAGQSQLYAGVHYPSDVEAGLALGRSVGEKIMAIIEVDRANAVWDGDIPTGPDKWIGENPAGITNSLLTPLGIRSVADYLPPPPPAIDSEQMQAELAELKSIERTTPQAMNAWVWHSYYQAYGYWYDQISTKLFEYDLTDDVPQAALMYATLSVVSDDAINSCFNAKYTYWMIRPPDLESGLGSLFPSPPHPSYPSAHSCSTMSMAMVIGHFFPEIAEPMQAAAHDAGNSRLVAGIHYASDRNAGEALGQAVAADVLARVQEMTE